MRGLRHDIEGSQGAETVSEAPVFSLGFRRVRSAERIHSLGRFYIGGGRLFYMGASAQYREIGKAQAPQARDVYGLHRQWSTPQWPTR